MNIIILSLDVNGIRITKKDSTGIDIDSMQLFISKNIASPETIHIALQQDGDTSPKYTLTKTQMTNLEKDAFFGYKLFPLFSVPPGQYKIVITQGENNPIELKDPITIINSNVLMDEHEPTRIINRTIGPINAKILAQDVNSQQLSFYIRKKYDGVSFIDDNKQIFVDYIPLDPEDLLQNQTVNEKGELVTPTFLSSDDIEIVDNILPPAEQTGEWMLLKWTPPYFATKKAGEVSFAISILSTDEEKIYIWQTEPSTFTVSPNIGLRQDALVVIPGTTGINVLLNRINEIDALLGNTTDNDPANDTEVVIGESSALDYITEFEFTIYLAGTPTVLKAINGWTWEDWLSSEYNTVNLTAGNSEGEYTDIVYLGINMLLGNGNYISINDLISTEMSYEC